MSRFTKITFFSMLIGLFAFSANAQSVLLSEDFSGNGLPAGWSVVDNANLNPPIVWEWSTDTATSGGFAVAFEHPGALTGHVRIDSDGGRTAPGDPENTDLISPPIDCSGEPIVVLNYVEFYRKFQADTGRIYASTDGINWTLVHWASETLTPNTASGNPSNVEVDISSVAANQDSVWLRFNYVGNWDYYWFIDDVVVSTPPAADIAFERYTSNVSNGCNLATTEAISFEVTNKGAAPITTFMATYQVDGGTAVTENATLTAPILFNETAEWSFTQTADMSAAGVYLVDISLSLALDAVAENDSGIGAAISVDPYDMASAFTMGFEVPNLGNEIFDTWTVEDANSDGFTWTLTTANANNGSVAATNPWNNDGMTGADDWMFTPCLEMTQGDAYALTFSHSVGQDGNGTVYPEKLKVAIGGSPESGSMTTIEDLGELLNATYEEYVGSFVAPATGSNYVGFHCYSDADQFFLNLDDIRIEALSAPTADFSSNAVAGTGEVNFTNSSAGIIDSYDWTWGDGSSSSDANPGSHTYATSGTYEVCLTVTNLAGNDTKCDSVTADVTSVGVENISSILDHAVSLFPNPTEHLLNVSIDMPRSFEMEVELLDAVGGVIESVAFNGSNSNLQFDLSNHANGIYFVKVQADGATSTKRVILSR